MKIKLETVEIPLGKMYACATDLGVCMLEFSDRRALETEFKEIIKYYGSEIKHGTNSHIELLKSELKGYFEKKVFNFSVTLHTPGTLFQQKAWEALKLIPYGQTRSYLQQAKILNCPESVRAVANANGKNRVSIIIPCHRVIGEDGSLTGYGGGLQRKRWLLDFESENKGLF